MYGDSNKENAFMYIKYAPALLVGIVVSVGCTSRPKEQTADPKEAMSEKVEAEKRADKREAKNPESLDETNPKRIKLSASHILVMHAESKRKPVAVTRTKAEAQACPLRKPQTTIHRG